MRKIFPQYGFILTLLLALAMSASCGVQRPQVDSIADAIVVTSADIRSAAQVVKSLCGNTVENGPCAAGSLISTETKDSFKRSLQSALDLVASANRLRAAGNAAAAGDKLALADAIILALQAEITRRQGGLQ